MWASAACKSAGGGKQELDEFGCRRMHICAAPEVNGRLRPIPDQRAHARVVIEVGQVIGTRASVRDIPQYLGLRTEADNNEAIGFAGGLGPDALRQAVAPPGEGSGFADAPGIVDAHGLEEGLDDLWADVGVPPRRCLCGLRGAEALLNLGRDLGGVEVLR